MRAYLDRHGLELPWIAAEDKQSVREYADRQILSHDRRVGARFGLGAAELFHYLVKDDAFTLMADNDLSDEIRSLETT